MITINVKKANKVNGEWALFVSFPYDQKLVNTLRELPSRYWISESKEWEVPFSKLSYLIEQFKEYEIKINADKSVFEEKQIAKTPDNFTFKTKPFEHQIEGFNYGLQYDRWLLGDEQGLGKTKQVIDIAVAKKLQKGYKHCLIICAVNGLKWNWKEEIKIHSNETSHILGQRTQKNGKVKIGSNADKLADLANIQLIDSYFLITNIETLRDEKIANMVQKLCKNGTIGMVAVDEIHKCFDYDTLIDTSLGKLKIGDIVKHKINCDVISYNEHTHTYESKPIINYYENVIADSMVELTLETAEGIKHIKCTKNHKFLTSNRGWVEADELTSKDNIIEYLDNSCISEL